MILWLAEELTAVKAYGNQMSATKAWRKHSEDHPLEAAAQIAELVMEMGPLNILMGSDYISNGPQVVIEASSVPVLAGLYEGDRPFDGLQRVMIESIPDIVDMPDFGQDKERHESLRRKFAERDIEYLVRIMEWAGLLTWTGARSEPDFRIGERWRGGTISITPFGSWFVQGPLATEGLVSAPVVMALTVTLDDPPEEIVAGLAKRLEAGPLALVQAWDELGGYEGLPEQLWRVEGPGTAPLLEALGQTSPDRKTAKAARKSLIKHRSWLANQS